MGKYTNGLYGLTENELWTHRDIANSLSNAYKKLQESLRSGMENLESIKSETENALLEFNRGYSKSEGSTKKQISSNILNNSSNIKEMIETIKESIEEANRRQQFYADLSSNISTAVSNIANKYSTTGIDYNWYEGGDLRESSEINEILKKKNNVRYNIKGSYVETVDS